MPVGVFARHAEMFEKFIKTDPVVVRFEALSSHTALQPSVNSEQQISDEAAFDMFFIKVVSLERTAAKAEASGRSGRLWRNYLLRNGFSEVETEIIREIAREHAAEIEDFS